MHAPDTSLLPFCSVAAGHREPLPEEWPQQVQQLLARCWAQQPEERPSMASVAQEVSAWLRDRALVASLDKSHMGHSPDDSQVDMQAIDCGCVIC